jgi:hypothetical protein
MRPAVYGLWKRRGPEHGVSGGCGVRATRTTEAITAVTYLGRLIVKLGSSLVVPPGGIGINPD